MHPPASCHRRTAEAWLAGLSGPGSQGPLVGAACRDMSPGPLSGASSTLMAVPTPQVDIDFCEPSPCQNGATCTDYPGGYSCEVGTRPRGGGVCVWPECCRGPGPGWEPVQQGRLGSPGGLGDRPLRAPARGKP